MAAASLGSDPWLLSLNIAEYLKVDQQAWKTLCTEVATPPANGNVADLAHFYADDVDQPLMTPDLAQSALIIDAFVVVFHSEIQKEDEVARLESSTCDHLLQCLHKAIWPDGAPPRTTEAETSNNTCMNRWTLKQLVTSGSKIISTVRGLLNRNVNESTFPAIGAPTTSDSETETSNNTCMSRLKGHAILKQLVTFGTIVVSIVRRVLKLNLTGRTFPALPSASELHKSGFRFRGTDGGDIRLVKSFHRLTAILYIPKLKIEDSSEKRLRNMCVYELITGQSKAPGSWYVHFMDELINQEEDVRLLLQGKPPVIAANLHGR
ncbi:hypothetical protein R1sor_026679 [Riccia sorocarpa]|uniref:Uncharacterized protein n=1 Tax=Riccia sorocarpa TaxID=122646 RepID=A0ABD3GDJ9_9MARC